MQIDNERRNRPVTNLSNLQKKVLKLVYSDECKTQDWFSLTSPEGAALESLNDLGLVHLVATKEGLGAIPNAKGRLLLAENPELVFPLPEYKRWKITTGIAIGALIIALGSLIVAILSLLLSAGNL